MGVEGLLGHGEVGHGGGLPRGALRGHRGEDFIGDGLGRRQVDDDEVGSIVVHHEDRVQAPGGVELEHRVIPSLPGFVVAYAIHVRAPAAGIARIARVGGSKD